MPLKAWRYCAAPSCNTLVRGGRCERHRLGSMRERDATRSSPQSRGYTWQWQKRSKSFRQRYPLCGMRPDNLQPVMSLCHDEGRMTPAYQTDHVVPHRGDQDLFWDENYNWQALCRECGARKSAAGL